MDPDAAALRRGGRHACARPGGWRIGGLQRLVELLLGLLRLRVEGRCEARAELAKGALRSGRLMDRRSDLAVRIDSSLTSPVLLAELLTLMTVDRACGRRGRRAVATLDRAVRGRSLMALIRA